MARSLTAALLTFLLLPLAGCSDSDDPAPEPDGSPPTSSAAAPSSDPAPEPTPAAVAFEFNEGAEIERTFDCNRFRDFVLFEQFSADADVELTSVTPVGSRIDLVRATITGNREQADSAGSIAVEAGGSKITDQPGWRGRRPVAGATVVAGTTYTVFFEVTGRPGARLEAFDVAYVADGVRDSARWPFDLTREPACR